MIKLKELISAAILGLVSMAVLASCGDELFRGESDWAKHGPGPEPTVVFVQGPLNGEVGDYWLEGDKLVGVSSSGKDVEFYQENGIWKYNVK